MGLSSKQKQSLVQAAGKLAQALLRGAARKQKPKNNNMGAPIAPQQQGCGACSPRKVR